MNLKDFLDEVRNRGEKLKDEIVDELTKSKALNQIVGNKNFVQAVSRVIETKDEVKRAINKQVKSLFHMMDIPNKFEFSKIGDKIAQMERSIEKLGISSIAIRTLPKSNGTSRSAKSHKGKSTAAKKSTRTTAQKRSTGRKKSKKA